MSTTQNLCGEKAILKLRGLIENTPTCMFCSGLRVIPIHVCPMQVQQVDEQGYIWFFSGADSFHNGQIAADPSVHLIFSNHSRMEYLTVFGEATILLDSAKTNELWSKFVEAWFPEGRNDPNLTLIKVRPSLSRYWDTENGKLITYAKILTAALTGSGADDGVQGTLSV